ncbi:hypothetical protein HDC92_003984 [Pedobacter sp. AK017]|nr:hypothetical protein [Pedobacter sp. AK017]
MEKPFEHSKGFFYGQKKMLLIKFLEGLVHFRKKIAKITMLA